MRSCEQQRTAHLRPADKDVDNAVGTHQVVQRTEERLDVRRCQHLLTVLIVVGQVEERQVYGLASLKQQNTSASEFEGCEQGMVGGEPERGGEGSVQRSVHFRACRL
jgi:hypothetical protein